MYNTNDLKYLGNINSPDDLKKINIDKLNIVADEIRNVIIDTVSENGGHLASNLGIVELTMMLHYIFNSPNDKFIFDVGHQTYTHKILTGRLKEFDTIRKKDGLSGFPKRIESMHDIAETGHASTSLSVSLGVEVANKYYNSKNFVVAIIGDGAMTGGLALEAINNISHIPNNLIVIVNNNEMSIGNNIGGISKSLNNTINDRHVQDMSKKIKEAIGILPFGNTANEIIRRLEGSIRNFIAPGIIFRDLGFKYFGPVDGHDIKELANIFNQVKSVDGPIIIQINTKKGKGYKPAEEHPESFHGTGSFHISTGKLKSNKVKTFSSVAGDIIINEALINKSIVAITAAMTAGTGLTDFANKYPDRFFDVGIAEGHASSFASGLSINGLIPVLFLYSTFLQRAYDQVIHDIALMNLHIIIMIDRAGIVPDDGETHQGIFDIAYLRIIPNIVILSPTNDKDFEAMFNLASITKSPFAIRYPKDKIENEYPKNITTTNISIGKCHIVTEGSEAIIISYSTTVNTIYKALEKMGDTSSFTLINLLSLKPLDEETLIKYFKKHNKVLIIEEAIEYGSIASAILELINKNNINDNEIKSKVYIHALPNTFIETATRAELLHKYGLDEEGIINIIKKYLK